jgi:VCBS repeat-containing protein
MATYTHSDLYYAPYWYIWPPPCTSGACDAVIYYWFPLLDWNSAVAWNVQSTSSTTVTLLNFDYATTTVLTGTDFIFDASNNALAGTVTKIERFDGGTLLETVTDIAMPLVEFQATSVAGALAGDDVINGGAYTDLLFGYSGNDTFNPAGAMPTSYAPAHDLMVGGLGNDVFNGGANPGVIVVYAFEWGSSGVTVNLGAGTATDTYGDTDTLNDIRVVIATNQNDQLIGGNNDETFQPGGGTDTIDGGGGFDVLDYTNFDPYFGIDFFGAYVESGITVNATGAGSGTISSTSYGEDTFTGIERVVGTEFPDTFNGSAAGESFSGVGGNDVLNGGEGNDLLEGGADDDVLNGGGGNDLLKGGAGRDMLDGGSGTDTISYDDALYGGRADLSNPATNTGDAAGDTYTSIENLTGSDFGDWLFGNSSVNVLIGGLGNDFLDGKAGDDTMIGGAGDDIYLVDSSTDVVTENAGEGNDIVFASVDYTIGPNIETLGRLVSGDAVVIGGAGDDLYLVESSSGLVNENLGEGNDTVYTLVDYTISPNIEKLVLFEGPGNINGSGNDLNNVLVGNSGHNVLDGKGGDDTMIGGAGNDRYYVDSTDDVVTENPDGGFEWVYASADYTLGANIEGLVLEGAGNINGFGNNTGCYLSGNSGNNRLSGGDGGDELNGAGGDDTMIGGAGNDRYYVDSTSDLVIENLNEGIDGVYASLDYTLGPTLEWLTLFGAGNINGVGNDLNNGLRGNSGNNTLIGGAGDDSLDGGPVVGTNEPWGRGGDDTLIGGAGNDWYHVDSTSDLVIENLNEGFDTVYASSDYTLSPNVESLVLDWQAPDNSHGSGNNLNNTLVGNYAGNVLDGKGGQDVLTGGNARDTFVFAAGEANGDTVVDFERDYYAGTVWDSFRFVGFGTVAGGATFTQIDTTNQWQIHSGLDGHNEIITLLNGASVQPTDYVFVEATANRAPVATAESYLTNEDQALNIAAAGVLLNDTDADNDPLTAVLVSDVQHGTLALTADGSFRYTPTANYNGLDSFTYRANDGQADSNVVTVSLTVNPVNDLPVASNDSYAMKEDTTLTASMLANDTDVDEDALSVSLVSGPAHGTVTLTANESFTYTPAANYNGADSFTYKANDGQADSNVATVSLTVTPNVAPVTNNDSYAVTEHKVLTVNAAAGVLANDSDVDGDPLYAALVSGPAHGKLTFNSDGSFVYKPLGHYNGPDSFTYKAFDGSASSDVTTVSITVNAMNQSLAIRDFNAEANSDILRQHDSDSPAIWTMDGSTPTDIPILPNPGSDWHLV